MSMDSIVIGIDLGTTNSCVAYYYNGNVKILENREGGRTTPSFIFFTEKNPPVIVGQYAKQMADQKAECGVYEMKRLLGREFEDKRVQEKRKFYPFAIKNVKGKPVVVIEVGKRIFTKTPQELSALVLQKIKADVDERLDANITKAVITVPAYFNSLQRKETLEAAKQAGFTVLKLLNEPNAAALNYYYENLDHCQYLLVYDLGGGTFDVSILKKSGSNVEVLCVDGDSHLGGNDFDDLIVNFVCEELLKNHKIDVMKNDKRKLMRLNTKCEEAKKTLSMIDETEILLEAFVKGHDRISISFSRRQLEAKIAGLVKKTLDITKRCIDNSIIAKRDIQQVILAGGSTRIPKIQAMLSEYFGRGMIKKTINPDECVAFGAALQAAMLSEHPRQSSEKTKIVDVVPLSIGTVGIGGCMEFLIKKDSQIPISVTENYSNLEHNQSKSLFNLYEGERLDCRKNNKLGEVVVNITPAPPGECFVSLTVHIDSTGILTCTAEERIGGRNRKEATIDFYTRGIRSDSEIKEAIQDAENCKAEDEEFRAYSDRLVYLQQYCAAITYNLTVKNLAVSHKDVFDRCKQINTNFKQINTNFKGNNFFYNRQSVEDILDQLTEECDEFVRYYNFEKMPTRKF